MVLLVGAQDGCHASANRLAEISIRFFLAALFDIVTYVIVNRPRSIYQYSNMGPRLSGLTSIFGVVFFVSKSPLGIEGQKKL